MSSNITEYNETAVAWGSHKQTVPITYTNITKTTSVYKTIKRTLEIRRFLESMNDRVSGLTRTMEDNQSTITQIKKDILTPHIHQVDIVLTWLHYQYIRGIFMLLYIDTKKNKGDMNTKPHGRETLVDKVFSTIGYKFIPHNLQHSTLYWIYKKTILVPTVVISYYQTNKILLLILYSKPPYPSLNDQL